MNLRTHDLGRACSRPAFCLLALLLLVLGSCSSPRGVDPDISALYASAASIETRNPVVVIHGILGARLQDRETSRSVWGAFDSKSIDPATPMGARLLALPLEIPSSARDYDPEKVRVFPAGPLDKLKLEILFQVISVEVYASILRTLGVGGYLDPLLMDHSAPEYPKTHFTCFTFFYDWRRDCVENAIRLGVFLADKRREIATRVGMRVRSLRDDGHEAEAARLLAWHEKGYKFDIVAHSMGGLVARYFLRYGDRDLPEALALPEVPWDGAREIDRLVCVGTPSFGAMEAFENLHGGISFGIFLPSYGPELLGTMPAIYQLLPRKRHELVLDRAGEALDVDLFDPELWRANGWGLARRDSDDLLRVLLPEVEDAGARRRRALDYQAWCLKRAKDFHRALDRQGEEAAPAQIHLYAADTQRTKTRVRLLERRGLLEPDFDHAQCYDFGDGTVPRFSASADERHGTGPTQYLQSPVPWTAVNFISDDHIGLTSNPHFTNNLLFLLLERPSMGSSRANVARPAPRPPAVHIPPKRPASRPISRPASGGA